MEEGAVSLFHSLFPCSRVPRSLFLFSAHGYAVAAFFRTTIRLPSTAMTSTIVPAGR